MTEPIGTDMYSDFVNRHIQFWTNSETKKKTGTVVKVTNFGWVIAVDRTKTKEEEAKDKEWKETLQNVSARERTALISNSHGTLFISHACPLQFELI